LDVVKTLTYAMIAVAVSATAMVAVTVSLAVSMATTAPNTHHSVLLHPVSTSVCKGG